MGRVAKIILVDLPHHPYSKHWKALAEKIANELGVPLEVKNEDYVFAIEHGETDDLGMASLPQLFAVLEGGEIRLLLARFPFNPTTLQADPEEAYRVVKEKIKEVTGEQ